MKTKPDVVVLGEELMADSANTSKVKGSCNYVPLLTRSTKEQ
jgi:hypothetical protein